MLVTLPEEDIQAVSASVRNSESPLTARQVSKKVFGTERKAQVSGCEVILMRLVGDGAAFEHPPIRSKSRRRYWHTDVVSRISEQIADGVARESIPPTVLQLRRRIAKCDSPWFDESLGRLLNERRCFEISFKGTRRLASKPPSAHEMLSATDIQCLERIIRKTASCRPTTLSLNELLGFLETSLAQGTRVPVMHHITESMLETWYHEELPNLLGSTSVPLPNTWDRYLKWCGERGVVPDLHEFHSTLRRLSDNRIVELIAHGRSQPIPTKEEPVLMKGSRGETIYFWRWRKGRQE
jgi:hypothetical protein